MQPTGVHLFDIEIVIEFHLILSLFQFDIEF